MTRTCGCWVRGAVLGCSHAAACRRGASRRRNTMSLRAACPGNGHTGWQAPQRCELRAHVLGLLWIRCAARCCGVRQAVCTGSSVAAKGCSGRFAVGSSLASLASRVSLARLACPALAVRGCLEGGVHRSLRGVALGSLMASQPVVARGHARLHTPHCEGCCILLGACKPLGSTGRYMYLYCDGWCGRYTVSW